MKMPDLTLSQWHEWSKRKTFDGRNAQGVYVISITDKPLNGTNVAWADVCYIGSTTAQTGLAGRWRVFDRALRAGLYPTDRHAAAQKALSRLGPHEHWTDKIYFAAMVVEFTWHEATADDTRKIGWVKYLEYEALAQYREANPSSRRPKLSKH